MGSDRIENAPLIEYQMFRYNRLDIRPFLAAVLELCRSEKSFWQRIIPLGKQRDRRRNNGVLTPDEQTIREEILAGLIQDKGGESQIPTAMRVLAEIIASDVSLLVSFNRAIEAVIRNNVKARENPKALAQLDGYKRPLVGSLSANLQRFGMDRIAKTESLQEIIDQMTEDDETGENSSPASPRNDGQNRG